MRHGRRRQLPADDAFFTATRGTDVAPMQQPRDVPYTPNARTVPVAAPVRPEVHQPPPHLSHPRHFRVASRVGAKRTEYFQHPR